MNLDGVPRVYASANQAVVSQSASIQEDIRNDLLVLLETASVDDVVALLNRHKLGELHLSGSTLSIDGFTTLTMALPRSRVTRLRLASCGITDNYPVANLLDERSTLAALDLSSNQLTSRAARFIGNALGRNVRLVCLDLSHNQVDHAGFCSIMRSVCTSQGKQSANRTLQVLIFKGNCDGKMFAPLYEHLGAGSARSAASEVAWKVFAGVCAPSCLTLLDLSDTGLLTDDPVVLGLAADTSLTIEMDGNETRQSMAPVAAQPAPVIDSATGGVIVQTTSANLLTTTTATTVATASITAPVTTTADSSSDAEDDEIGPLPLLDPEVIALCIRQQQNSERNERRSPQDDGDLDDPTAAQLTNSCRAITGVIVPTTAPNLVTTTTATTLSMTNVDASTRPHSPTLDQGNTNRDQFEQLPTFSLRKLPQIRMPLKIDPHTGGVIAQTSSAGLVTTTTATTTRAAAAADADPGMGSTAMEKYKNELNAWAVAAGSTRSAQEAVRRIHEWLQWRDPLAWLGLEELNLRSVPPLPVGISSLGLSSNQLTTLRDLPSTLVQLDASSNALTAFPRQLPPCLEEVNLQSNQIGKIPEDVIWPDRLRLIWLAHNRIAEFPKDVTWPDSLRELRLTGNSARPSDEDILRMPDGCVVRTNTVNLKRVGQTVQKTDRKTGAVIDEKCLIS